MTQANEVYQDGAACLSRGDMAGAEAVCRQLLTTFPREPEPYMMLSAISHQAARPDLSLQYLRQAVALAPNNSWVRYNMGVVLQMLGQGKEAAECFELAVRLRPDYVEALTALASVCVEGEDYVRAEALCDEALRQRGDCGDAFNVRGHVRARQGRLSQAIESFLRATELSPKNAFAFNNLAAVHQQIGQEELAMKYYRRALEINPNYAEAHSNLGALLYSHGELGEAETHLRQAAGLMPNLRAAQVNLGGVLQARGRLAEAIACFSTADELSGGDPAAVSNILMCMNYDPAATPEALLAEHVRYGRRFCPLPPPGAVAFGPSARHDRAPDRTLRVGYVSADFRQHAISNFIIPVLESHDRRQVTSVCYSGVTAEDSTTAQFKSAADVWRPTHGLSDGQLAELVRKDRVDILVDLAGHTGRGKLKVFARQPAPVSITWLGYPNTTGLGSIQYCLTDAIVDPLGAEAHFTESLYRLEGCFCCYRHMENDPGVSPSPAARNGYVTFGSTHGLIRLNRNVLDTWAKLMQAVPSAHLLIFRNTLHGQITTELAEGLISRGIPASRFDLQYKIEGQGGYMRTYHDIDILLDTFPWSGHTTACQALWMGAPVVTLRGSRHAGRRVASVLHHAGLADWIGDTPEQYVKIAAALASNIPALAAIRATLREKFAASAVCDAAGFTRTLETAYRQMWRRWIESARR